MPGKLILSLALCVLALSHGCSGNRRLHQRRHICDIKRLTATEPHLAMKDEAGVTEIWDYQTPEFLCAGIVAVRLVLHPGGLVLPSYNTAPFLSFALQGRGVHGVVVPGCPNTFQSETESESPRGGEKRDHHQKLFRSREGDVISSPADVLQWIYNDGDTDYVSITLFDTKSFHNQLDRKVRSFFIAGKSQQSREYSRINGGNIFSGFDKEILREVFPGVNYETIHKIQAQDDERGSIVLAPDLQLQIPEESQQGEHSVNGVEESLCNLKFTHNLNNSSQSDYLDRCAGRINTVNGNALPILQFLRLSAAHVVLYKNAVLGPQWMVNAHIAVYVTKGDGRFSVVNDEGNAMFDDVVQKGQILVIPQGFAVAAKAGGEGLEWVEMRTNEDAVSSAVAGRNSVLGAIPAEVLANAFDISREQAVRLKNGSPEIGICRPFGESSEREQHDVV